MRQPQSSPGLRLHLGSPLSSFPQVTRLDRRGGPVLPRLLGCEMPGWQRPCCVSLDW